MAFPLVIVGGPWDAGKGEAEAMYKAGSGTGGRYGSGKGSGLNPAAGEGAATGRGTTAGTGSGAGAGTTVGSGKGAGSAAGSGGFPGITISGGRYGNGNGDPAGLHAALTPHHQTSYAMTITSTASSGGGLPDVGIFQGEEGPSHSGDTDATVRDPETGAGVHGRAGIEVRASTDRRLRDP